MPELTASTREAARRIGISETAHAQGRAGAAALPASRTASGTSTRPAAA